MHKYAIFAALFASSLTVSAQSVFEVEMDPFQEVPPHNTPAYGDATVSFDPNTSSLSVAAGGGNYSDLLAGATSVTLSDAAAGANGPTIFTLTLDNPGTTSGTFQGSGTLTAGQITDLQAGNLYINVRDSVYPSGEIRGQLLALPEPSALILAGLGALALCALQRTPRA